MYNCDFGLGCTWICRLWRSCIPAPSETELLRWPTLMVQHRKTKSLELRQSSRRNCKDFFNE